MNIAHSVTIRVFCGQEENRDDLVNGLKFLLRSGQSLIAHSASGEIAPFDLEKEKIAINRQTAFGFNDRKINIFEASLTKSRHVNAFLENLLGKLPEIQKQMLLNQLESRIDDDRNLFVRLEKERLAKHNDMLMIDGGNCYHIRIKVAAFPASKEAAVAVMKKVMNGNKN
ncbi:MAG TPA: RNA-binding domain-containing protein [Candidatus Nanoarchaeia archaeon]|nr:RNA-binding domain-containing protein [Candidatus Nanoarchaeia archaeon]